MLLPRSAVTCLLLTTSAVSLVAGLQTSTAGATTAASYVALGDSYTAGPLVPNQLPDPPGCWRSDRNYPHLVASAWGSTLRDPSCSGATTEDLTSPQPVLGGPNPPQLDALDGEVDEISVQIGGNDIGFSEILGRCTALLPLGTSCQDWYTRGGVDEISRRIAAAGPKVGAVLAEAGRRAPGARAFVVGYPAILPEVGPGRWPIMPVAPADVPDLREKEKELNAMLATQATAAGATYVDIYGPSVGHDACQLPGVRWVEPLLPLSPAAPVHPNALGMQATVAVLLEVMA